jgi:hypothetical protein
VGAGVTNRPKAIGTATETAVVRALHTLGFPGAERRALHGALDLGDITACPGIILEVKGGQAAKTASDLQVHVWHGETMRERDQAGADIGLLVLARKGIGPANARHWWVVTSAPTLAYLYGGTPRHEVLPTPLVRLTLGDATRLLRMYGYGDPISDETP